MKLEIEIKELGNLKQEEDGKWSWYVITKNGILKREGFVDEADALRDAERNMMIIIKAMLKKKK